MIHQEIDQLTKVLRVHWLPKGPQGTSLQLPFAIHHEYFSSFLNMIFKGIVFSL